MAKDLFPALFTAVGGYPGVAAAPKDRIYTAAVHVLQVLLLNLKSLQTKYLQVLMF